MPGNKEILFSIFIVCLTFFCLPSISCYMNRCFKPDDLSILWTKHVGSQFVASPIVGDFTLHEGREIIVETQTGDLTLLSGKTGDTFPDTFWPQKLNIASIHASPLLYDVNKDGMKDVLVITTEGDILVYYINGKQLTKFRDKLKDVFIQKNCYEKEALPVQVVNDFKTMNGLIIDKLISGIHSPNEYVKLSPHVFATGVIEDINNDNTVEELVLPVTYLVETNSDIDVLESNVIHSYVVSAVVVFNLTSFQVISKFYTELDKKNSANPPYALTSPLVVNYMDYDNEPQIVLATTGLKVTHLNYLGKEITTAYKTNGITEQISVEDISFYETNSLDFIYAEIGGHVICMNSANVLVWDTNVKGEVTGIRLFERKTVDGSLVKIVVVATTDGRVWLLSGKDGRPLPRWPTKLGKELKSPPNVLQIVHDGQIYIGVLDTDGYLHMVSIDQGCKFSIEIGETTKVGFIIDDLDSEIPGLEFVIATTHGTMIAVGLNVEKYKSGKLLEDGVTEDMFNSSFLSLFSWPGQSKSHNVFMYSGSTGCIITNVEGYPDSHIDLEFSIFDHSPDMNNPSRRSRGKWSANIYVGDQLVSEVLVFQDADKHIHQGIKTTRNLHLGPHSISFKFNKITDFMHIEVRCYQHYRQLYSNMVSYKIVQTWSKDVMLLLMLPFIFLLLVFLIDGLMSQKSGGLISGQHLD